MCFEQKSDTTRKAKRDVRELIPFTPHLIRRASRVLKYVKASIKRQALRFTDIAGHFSRPLNVIDTTSFFPGRAEKNAREKKE